MTTTRDLEKLLKQSIDGDMDAFERLYHATSAKLFGIVLRILKNRAQSEDALQDIYVRIWQKAADFEPGRASIITWMSTIARNRAIDIVRRQKPEVDTDDAEIEIPYTYRTVEFFDKTDYAEMLDALTPQQLEVLENMPGRSRGMNGSQKKN